MDPKHLTLLRIHDACRGLSDDQIDEIAACVNVIQMDAGNILYAAGDAIDAMYIVLEGRLKMTLPRNGGDSQTIRFISAGDQFGFLMLALDDAFPVSVVVDEQATLLRFPMDALQELIDRFPVFRRNLMRKVGRGLQGSILGKQPRPAISKIVSFVHADEASRNVVAEIVARLAKIGEKIGVLSDSESPPFREAGVQFKSLRQSDSEFISASEVRATVAEWGQLERVLLVVDLGHHFEGLTHLLKISDKVMWVSTTSQLEPTCEILEKCIGESPSWRRKMHFVWALQQQERVAPLQPKLTQLVDRDFKIPAATSATDHRQHQLGLDRLIHFLRGVSIGVALSGGAAHGMAHLGVLQAFEEHGIAIDKLAGTSAGVLTGVVYAAGYDPQWEMQHFAHDLEPGSMFKWLPRGDGFYMLEKYRSHSWDGMLRKYLFDWKLEQLPQPMYTVTTDLISARSVVRSSGDAVESILESINLPVLSPPICRDGMLLVDGGILNNLPADVLVDQGCDYVVGVDVAANIEKSVGKNTVDTPASDMKTPGVITTLMRCLRVQAHNMSGVGGQRADLTIAPDVSMFESTSFTKAAEMAAVGHRAASEAMPQLQQALRQLDESLF